MNGNRTFFFYYDDGQLLAWQSQSTPSIVPLMLWGADGLIGYRYTDAQGTSRARYFTYNLHGDLTQALDEAGNIAEIGAFNAHGAPLKDGAGVLAVGGMFGYGAKFGYVRDGESGFYLCGFRYYDPSSGRWITRDPIGYAGGQNLYGYVGNDPVNGVDPDGLNPVRQWAIRNLPTISRGANAAGRGIANYVGPRLNPSNYSLQNGANNIANAASRVGQWFSRGSAPQIRFGQNANQSYHVFRHIDKLGLDRRSVQEAVQRDCLRIASQITSGEPFNRVIKVAGQKIQYTAFRLPNGTINIGRIHEAP